MEILQAQTEQLSQLLEQQDHLLLEAGGEGPGALGRLKDLAKVIASEVATDVQAAVIDACRDLLERHPPGLCKEMNCGPCQDQRHHIILETVDKIEEKIPGTRELLVHWEFMNQKITIVN